MARRAFVLVASLLLACGDASVGSLEGRSNNGTASEPGATSPGEASAQSSDPEGASASSATPDGGSSATTNANLTCTSCHGDATRVAIAGADANVKAAPPKTATATGAAGAHQAHLNLASSVASPIACDECHVVPTSTSHSNGKVDVAFGTLAKTGGAAPAFDGASCSKTYCHGWFDGGNTNAAPAWTGGAMTCTSCHGAPPAEGQHLLSPHVSAGCQACHGTGYSATAVVKATHINGKKNVGGAGSKINSYNATTGSCSPTCHGTKSW